MRINRILRATLLSIILLCCVGVTSLGQEPNSNTCADLMKFGIYDEYNTTTDSQKFALTKAFICSSKFASYGEARKSADSWGIDVGIFDLKFGGSGSDEITVEKWGEWSEKFCHSTYDEVRENFKFMSTVRIVSPALMGVVKKCLESDVKGLRAWGEPNKDRTAFTFNARYVQVGSELAQIDAPTDFSPADLKKKCTGTDVFAVKKKLAAGKRTMTCNGLDPKVNYSVTIHTTQGDQPFRLDARPPVPIATLTADLISIIKGQSTTLRWTSQNANRLVLEASDGTKDSFNTPSGMSTRTPSKSSSYVIHAFGSDDEFSTSPVFISVKQLPASATFSVDKHEVAYGRPVKLTWSTVDAVKVTIDQGIGDVELKGSRDIYPKATTTYTLTAIGEGLPSVQTVKVNVLPKITFFRNTDFGGEGYDVFDPVGLPFPWNSETSSIRIYTDEWVVLTFKPFINPVPSYLLVKGARSLNNLHTIPLAGYEGEHAHWGDKVWTYKFIDETEAQNIKKEKNLVVLQ